MLVFAPPANRPTSMAATLSPVALSSVAIGSTNVPMIITAGMASVGSPYTEIISISPIYPPLGIPPATTLTNTVIPRAVSSVIGSKKSQPISTNATYILTMLDIDDPSLCKVAPSGMTTLATAGGTPIFAAAARFTGMVAILLQVPTAVAEGRMLCFQNRLTPGPPPAT